MALRQLLITKNISKLRAALEELAKKDTEFEQRRADMKTREAELEAAINEVTDETPEGDRTAVEESVSTFEKDRDALDGEASVHEEEKNKLEEEIRQLKTELEEINSRAAVPPPQARKNHDERKEEFTMNTRMKFFAAETRESVAAIMQRDEVKDFVTRTREMIGQQRAVTGAELNIPDILLGIMRDTLHKYSKLISRVRLVRLSGTGRQNIAGTIPEGVWTEACANLNELAISFSQIELDGYKVGGFIAICNAILEDSDLDLADEILYNIAQAIGLAIDKAILYGTGVKMPVGIVTRLAQSAEPGNWGANAPTWTDLRSTNIKKINPGSMTAEQFYSALILNLGIPKANYSAGGKWWVLNSKTFATLQAKALTINATGAIVSGQTQTMPIVGGDIIILEFMPENDVVGGYGDLYLLLERKGIQLANDLGISRFTQDQTVFKGTARYDGKPVFGEGFVAVNINNTDPTLTATFAPDSANP